MTKALQDLTVLEISDDKGMYAGKLLADMGATVILIEPPTGHAARRTGPFAGNIPDINTSLLFWYNSTNKKSITVDIETDTGATIVRELAKSADILLESMPPDYLDSLGLGYSQLSQINPQIIVTSITPFGQTGPYRNYEASNLVLMAMSGIMNSCGYDDLPGSPPICCDGLQGYATGCNLAVISTLTALHHRDTSSMQGQWVDCSIYEALSGTTEAAMPNWYFGKQTPFRQTGRHHGTVATPSTQYESSDGKLINGFDIPPRTVARWDALIAWMDETGMAGELNDDSYRQMIRNRSREKDKVNTIVKLVRTFIHSMPAEEAYHRAQQIRLAWAIIRSPEETLEDPHFTDDRGFFPSIYHPETDKSYVYPGAPYTFHKTPWSVDRRAPLLGEDTLEILHTLLDFNKEDLVLLRESGVI
jgi:crotonobetainyl-CoA:carnitine CoA-transferase CaiB-like acyl-CoA transferase